MAGCAAASTAAAQARIESVEDVLDNTVEETAPDAEEERDTGKDENEGTPSETLEALAVRLKGELPAEKHPSDTAAKRKVGALGWYLL